MRLLRLLAWGLLAAICLATLLPIQFRPESGLPVQAERFLAFLVAGFVFALAYRRHFIVVGLLLIAAALLLELGQLLVPTRHSGVPDLEAKLLGAVCGVLAGRLLGGYLRSPPPPRSQ